MVHNSAEKEADVVEEEASQQKSKERRNGIVGPPPVLTSDGKQVKIGGESDKADRRRRNGIVDAPFVGPDGFVTSPHHQTIQDSRSR